MGKAAEDGVGEGGIADNVVPAVDKAALRHDRREARWLTDGPIDGERFGLYVEKMLLPTYSAAVCQLRRRCQRIGSCRSLAG